MSEPSSSADSSFDRRSVHATAVTIECERHHRLGLWHVHPDGHVGEEQAAWDRRKRRAAARGLVTREWTEADGPRHDGFTCDKCEIRYKVPAGTLVTMLRAIGPGKGKKRLAFTRDPRTGVDKLTDVSANIARSSRGRHVNRRQSA